MRYAVGRFIFAISIMSLLSAGLPGTAAAEIAAPVLKWWNGGSYVAWYSPVAVADLDGDGDKEVVVSGYRLSLLAGADGSEILSLPANAGRVWSGAVLADINADGGLEIVTADSDGYLRVFNANLANLWYRQPSTSPLYSLAAADLDADGTLEIVVGLGAMSAVNTWVYEHNGDRRPGWPQLSTNPGYAWGIFNDAIAIGDLNGDADAELVVPCDTAYISAYEGNGVAISASPTYGEKVWGQIRSFEDLALEIQGWGDGNQSNFSHGGAVVLDVDGVAGNEIVVAGSMYYSEDPLYPSLFASLFLFNPDRSRFFTAAGDWRVIPTDTGAPLSQDVYEIEQAVHNPVAADLDGDGLKEILFSSFDGRVHAFWLDKTEHGAWPYEVYSADEGVLRFASEPVVADLDDDGQAEVIFGSWTEKGSYAWGRLHVVDSLGNMIHEIELPAPTGTATWSGSLAAPTLAELDGDADLEVLINTANAGVVAYDLPGSAGARVLWKTGRGNYLRNGAGPLPICGDGVREADEECDDGNTDDGDGCSSLCESESGSGVPELRGRSCILGDARPNPFNPATVIQFSLATRQYADLAVFDFSGRLVRRLVAATLPAGDHVARWDGTDEQGVRVSSGVYLYRLQAGSTVETKKLALLK